MATQTVLHHGDGRKTHKPVEAQAGNVQDFVPVEQDVFIVFARHFISVGVVDVIQLPAVLSVNFDVFREKRIKAKDAVFPVAHDLGERVSPKNTKKTPNPL